MAQTRFSGPVRSDNGFIGAVTGDITGNFLICLNRGTPKQPRLDPAHPLYCDGIDLHGMWRVRPAVAKLGARMALALVALLIEAGRARVVRIHRVPSS